MQKDNERSSVTIIVPPLLGSLTGILLFLSLLKFLLYAIENVKGGSSMKKGKGEKSLEWCPHPNSFTP